MLLSNFERLLNVMNTARKSICHFFLPFDLRHLHRPRSPCAFSSSFR
jgi:hypothetical protein